MGKSKSVTDRPKIGLALGSGSARGWAHIGILEALAEQGITPDIVCGCSIGAFVGSAFVAGKLEELKKWTLSLSWARVMKLLDPSVAHGGVIKGDLIAEYLRTLLDEKEIAEYGIPFAAIATDLLTGREIWLQQGPMYQAVRASISLPGIFTPYKLGNKWLVDGGLVNPVPISVCRALGADVIIGVNLNNDLVGRRGIASEIERDESELQKFPFDLLEKLPEQIPESIREGVTNLVSNIYGATKSDTPGYFDVLFNSINIMQDRITRSRLAGDPPQVMLMPHLLDFNLMDFHRAEEAIKEGRLCVEQSLPLIRKFIS
jgi:NTE family protein